MTWPLQIRNAELLESLVRAMLKSLSVGEPLCSALRDFQDILSPDQKRDLLAQATVPDAAAVIILTAEIDNQNAKRRSRRVATRLNTFLESVQQFSSVANTFISPSPNMAALLWGSVKLAILAASNFFRFVQATIALWRPFEVEFGNFQNELQRQNKCVKREIDLASQQAAWQERQLQEMERKAASRYRLLDDLFHRKAVLESDEAHNWRLQADERKSNLFLPTITKQHSNKLVESDMALPAHGFVKHANLETG
ncbi:MAG: hypothetical protein M1813_000318 [Trichoglossum hirsutum]|nr:MAG: hypothetical protein M1813_000318 [Trichoglossum hirsutum]